MIDVDVLRADLLARLPDPSLPETAIAGVVAELAALLERVAVRARDEGWTEPEAELFCRLVQRLVRGLHSLGTERVDGSLVEGLAARAVTLADALFDEIMTPVHTA